jgi:hypothetical protein
MDAFGNDWLRSWKHRDLDAILSHYADDVELQSPLVVHLLGETSGTVVGKEKLREYFQKVLVALPEDVELELLGVFGGVDSLVVHFQAKGGQGAELMKLNAEGKARRAIAHGRALRLAADRARSGVPSCCLDMWPGAGSRGYRIDSRDGGSP